MERESFEDGEVAQVLNEIFVCIKVDREERPDVDTIYMAVCQAMTGSGGWPLTIIMTPDKKPFFAGTYFPKESRYGRVGVVEVARIIESSWREKRQELLESAEKIIDHVQEMAAGSPLTGELGEEVLERAYEFYADKYDDIYGGFGSAPKFPSPHNLTFLLRYWYRSGNKKALAMVEKTLQQMGQGGIYDQLGGGFHRYATDGKWLVPHFEKMLYDQALLAIAYVESFQATKKEGYAVKAREIFTYVLQEMTSPAGCFYSAEDADSEGEEGKFYLWEIEELHQNLPKEEAILAVDIYNVLAEGNFSEEATRSKTGKNILHLTKPLPEQAQKHLLTVEELKNRIAVIRKKLFAYREKRIHPYKDDKVLTDWNGLMVAALALGGKVLNEPVFIKAAEKAVEFITSALRREDGRLLKRYRDGEAAMPAQVDDYAFLIWGLLELYEATFQARYLREALALNELLVEHYWDDQQGGFFYTAGDGEPLIARPKELYDGAVPSGNSVAALNCLRLGRITGSMELEDKASQIIRAFAGDIARHPVGYAQSLSALDFSFGPSYEVIITGTPEAADTKSMLAALYREFIPNKVVVFKPAVSLQEEQEEASQLDEIGRLVPYLKDQQAIGGKATAYVCRNFACQAPTTDIGEMLNMFKDSKKLLK